MPKIVSTLAVVAAAALLATSVAAKSESDYFRECFCWDEAKQEFCGGSNWYNTQHCKNWFWAAFGFTIPAVIGLFVLLAFPLIFYCSRACCNCCGGRHRSEGCCCANSGSDHRVPEYTNRAIFVSKILMCVLFGAYTYYAVGGYTTNAKLHTDILGVVGDFGTSVDNVHDLVGKSAEELAHLSNTSMPGPYFPPAGFAQDAAEVYAKFGTRVTEIKDQLDNLRHAENNQQYGRAESVYRYPSCPLLVLLIGIIVMGCNARKLMGLVMILFCLTSILVGIVFVPHMVIAQGVTSMCDNYNQTVVPVVIGAVQSQGGCGSTDFIFGLNVTAANVERNLWYTDAAHSINAPSALCQSMRTVCAAKKCTYTTCGGVGAQLPFATEDPFMPFNMAAIELVLNTPFEGQTLQSILTCAVSSCNDQPAEVRAAARDLATFYENQYASLAFLYGVAYPNSLNCTGVRNFLQDPLHGDICDGGIDRRMSNVAMVLGVMYMLSFIGLPVLIRGMKRFMPMQRNQSLADVARETVMYADAKANAVPENPPYTVVDATAVYGSVNDTEAGLDGHHHTLEARAAGDAAFQRRFYGPNATHATDAARRPLLQDGESSAIMLDDAAKPL